MKRFLVVALIMLAVGLTAALVTPTTAEAGGCHKCSFYCGPGVPGNCCACLPGYCINCANGGACEPCP